MALLGMGRSRMKNQFGQLLLIEGPKAEWSPALGRVLKRFKPAGVLFRSLTTLTAIAEVTRKATDALEFVPFLAVEEDGGGPLCSLVGPLPSLGRLGERAAEGVGNLVGATMELVGLSLDLAPVIDLLPVSAEAVKSTHGARPSIPGGRSAEVTSRAEGFIRGLARHRVLPCARHFPGLATAGAHSQPAPVVERTMVTLWREDLVPYRTLSGKLPMVEISHAAYKAYDYEFPRPASMSPSVVEGLLRLKLRYEGVALAEVLVSSRAAGVEVSEAAVRALAAGCDLLLVPGDENSLEAVLTAVERAVDFGQLPAQRIEQALERTKHARKGLAIARHQPSERDLARLAHEFEAFRKQRGAGEPSLG